MKLISLGKIDKKFYISLILYIIMFITMSVIDYLVQRNEMDNLTNLELKKIITFGSCVFFGIPEYVIRKSLSNKRLLDKKIAINNKHSIIYIFRFKYKEINYKKFLVLILFLLLNYIYDFSTDIYYTANSNHYKLLSKDGINIVELVYIYIVFRPFQKINFYKHHYLSFLVVIIMELIRYFIRLFVIQKLSFDFPDDLICLIPLIIFPIFDTIYFYAINWYMKNNNYSPFLISFLIGFIKYNFFEYPKIYLKLVV